MFQQHLAIFHKSRPSAGVVPTPIWLSATNGFYRISKLSRTEGGKMGGQKIILGGHLSPLAPLPGAATGLNNSLWYKLLDHAFNK